MLSMVFSIVLHDFGYVSGAFKDVFGGLFGLRPETMAEILQRVLRLPVGSRILTMDPFFGHGECGLEAIWINGPRQPRRKEMEPNHAKSVLSLRFWKES